MSTESLLLFLCYESFMLFVNNYKYKNNLNYSVIIINIHILNENMYYKYIVSRKWLISNQFSPFVYSIEIKKTRYDTVLKGRSSSPLFWTGCALAGQIHYHDSKNATKVRVPIIG